MKVKMFCTQFVSWSNGVVNIVGWRERTSDLVDLMCFGSLMTFDLEMNQPEVGDWTSFRFM